MKKITLFSIVAARKDIATADMDGETVMMNIETGKYYNLGEMGGEIWALLGQPINVEKIINTLLEKYEVTRQLCEKEVLAFLNEAHKEGLLEVL